MDVNQITESAFIDIFGDGKGKPAEQKGFGGSFDQNVDILSTTETTTVAASTTDTTTVASTTDTTTVASTTDTTTLSNILGDDDKGKPGRKPKYDFSDMTGYFEDRMKSGKFVQIKEELDDGTEKVFVPKTPEDFDEAIELQINHRLEKERKGLIQQVYQSKSPAFQAVLKYSELVDDPAEVVPFIQGVNNIESVAQVDEKTPEGAEVIVRARLEQKGDTPELVQQQIDSLKTADKLLSTAAVYKPLIIQQEQAVLSQMVQQRQAEEQEYLQTITAIEKDAIKAIETPLFGKQKLTKEEKALVYDMIGYPNEQTQGYNIFSAIDALFQKGDYETLKILSLIAGGKKDAIFGYISTNSANSTAADIQRKLRVASSSGGSSTNNDTIDDDQPVIQRRQYTAKFGRQ